MDHVLGYLGSYKYLAMFGIIFLCGVGLPIPEEVTLIASGLFVGWGQADFFLASAACVAAILAGDSVIFFLGRHYGYRFLRFILSPERLKKAQDSFHRHSQKTVFFARFFAGIRIGVYAYAGAHRMSWFRFALLDLAGALISGPTSIWLGKFAAEKMGSPEEAIAQAQELTRGFHHWILAGIAALALLAVGFWVARRHRSALFSLLRRSPAPAAEPATATPPADTPGRADRSGERPRSAAPEARSGSA